VGLDPVFRLVPDRPDGQLALVDAEGRLGLRELDVGAPELVGAPVVLFRAQDVGSLGQLGPLAPVAAFGLLEDQA
jgi:hypothetical protein